MQRPRACGGCGDCRGCGGLLGLSCLPGLGHFVGSLWCLILWFLRNVARNSPTCISNIEIASLELQRFGGAAESSGTRITCDFWLMRHPRRTPVFGRRPTTLPTIPGTLRTPPHTPQCEEPLIGARQCRRRSHFANTGGTDESERPFVHRRTRAIDRHGSLIETRRVGNVHVVSIDREAPPEGKVARRPIRVG